jgi:hypothetical protein
MAAHQAGICVGYWQRLHLPVLLRGCTSSRVFQEPVELYAACALTLMIDHSALPS